MSHRRKAIRGAGPDGNQKEECFCFCYELDKQWRSKEYAVEETARSGILGDQTMRLMGTYQLRTLPTCSPNQEVTERSFL